LLPLSGDHAAVLAGPAGSVILLPGDGPVNNRVDSALEDQFRETDLCVSTLHR
jgi:hypothetical protein